LAEPVSALSVDLEAFLTQNGYQSIPVRSLDETLLTIQQQKIDALVLDAALLRDDFRFIPVIKGIEKQLPIIICAARNTPELETKIRKQGIFYYHIKSFGIQDLEMAISNAVKGLST
jgi:DNA-binding NtrC family response regulator